MRTPLLNPSPAAGHWEPKYPFDLLVAYEDLATRNLAMRLHDQLARQLDDDHDLQCNWWKFGYLADPDLCEQAADDAAGAHMIILSVHAAATLPGPARAWTEQWAARHEHHKCALVALVAGAEACPEETRHLLADLQRVARQARMDFFSHTDVNAKDAPDFAAARLAERASAVTPTLLEILQHRIPAPREGVHQP